MGINNKGKEGIIIIIIAIAAIFLLNQAHYLSFATNQTFYWNIWGQNGGTIGYPFYVVTYNGTQAVPATIYINIYNGTSGTLLATQMVKTTGTSNRTGVNYQSTGPGPQIFGGAPASAFSTYSLGNACGNACQVIYMNGSIASGSFSFTNFGQPTSPLFKTSNAKIIIFQNINGINYTVSTSTNVNMAQGATYYYPTAFVVPVLGGTPQTSSATTTGTSTSVSGSQTSPNGSTSAPSPFQGITSFFSSIGSYINGLISQLLSVQVPYSLSTSTTGSGINKIVNASANTTIPAGNQTVLWNKGINKVVQTVCSYYVINSTGYVLKGQISNVTGTYYTAKFSYTPRVSGAYAFGTACISAQNTWNAGTQSWQGWSTPVLVAQDNQTLQFTSGSSAAPPQVSLSNSFFSWIQGFINSLSAWLQSVGL